MLHQPIRERHIVDAVCRSMDSLPTYHPANRDSAENMNSLVRQYLPKITDFEQVTEQQLIWTIDRFNLRPRKCLDFLTPFEVFLIYLLHLMLESAPVKTAF
jgi:hypothetical protein